MSDEEAGASNVQVTVRCRPMNRTEIAAGNTSCYELGDGKVVLTHPTEGTKYEFVFDHMYDDVGSQEQVYNEAAAPLLDKAFAGFNGTIFAYGQTGSGKTHCMMGSGTAPEMQGIIPRMKFALFDRIRRELAEHPTRQFLVECSYFEVYNEIIYDLLDATRKQGGDSRAGQGLEIKEDKVRGIYVKGLKEMVVNDPEGLDALMIQGNSMRTQAATAMNERSSRSHSIFTIQIRQRDTADNGHNLFAKINLVDLAGSERADKTGATGDRLKEGSNINKSLSELGNVINKLAEYGKATGANKKKIFIPYRNSKLTRVLQESLGGNSLTCMIATCSPAASNFNETLTTLRYADRAKAIPVNATKNDESEVIEKLNKEIAALRKKLEGQADGGSGVSSHEARLMEERYRQQILDIESSMKQTWEEKAKLSAEYENERVKLLEEGKRETERLRTQFENERKRRWRLLEDKADFEQLVRELYGWEDAVSTTTGKSKAAVLLSADGGEGPVSSSTTLSPPPGADLNAWVAKFRQSVALVQVVKEKSTAAAVYRDSVVSDITKLSTSNTELTTESLTSAKSVVEQSETKLKMLKNEIAAVIAKRNASKAEATQVSDDVKKCLAGLQGVAKPDERASPSTLSESTGISSVSSGSAAQPTAPPGQPPTNRPARSSTRGKTGIALMSPEPSGPETTEDEETIVPVGKSKVAVVLLTSDSPSPTKAATAAPVDLSEEATTQNKHEIEALELVIRVIDKHTTALTKQADDAIRAIDVGGALAPLGKLLQAELEPSRAIPDLCDPVPPEAVDSKVADAMNAVLALAPAAGKKKLVPGAPKMSMRQVQSEMMTAITNGLDTLRKRYSAQLSALAAAVQAERASGASKLAELESLVSSLRVQVASLQSNVATAEDSLAQERSSGAALRQKLSHVNAELETAKTSLKTTTENATAAAAQVSVLTKKIGDVNDQLTKANQSLADTSAELHQTKAASANLERASAEKVEALTQRALKAEAQLTEEIRQRTDLSATFSSTESQLRSQIASLERNVADSEAALTSERTNAATLRQRITELTTQLEVAHASQSSTAENATAASSRVAELSKKLGDANEELVKLHQQLAESTVALRDVKSKLTTVKSESAAQIEHLNQRVRQAEAKVSEEAKDKMDALAKLSAVESNSKTQIASLETRLATAEESLIKERSGASVVKQQLSDANTELDMLKASVNSRSEAASAASGQVVSLSKQLGEANEELVKLNQRLSETTATLRETQAKLAVVESDSASRIDALNQRLVKAETQAAEDSRHKSELAVKLAALETQAAETQSALLRVQAESDAALEREKSLQSEVTSLHAALVETRQDRDVQREAASAAASEVQELKERVIVAEEERDAARDKEEEYFRELEERDEQISRIQEGYVDLSDRLNDKMDEVMEYRDELENWKEKANDWQQKALVAATVTPRGSALDAIPVRKAEMLARGVFFRIYTAISNADREVGKIKPIKASLPVAKSITDDDDYEDDFDEPAATPKPSSKAAAVAPVSPLKPLTHITSSDFEQKDLADLTTSLEDCVNTVFFHVLIDSASTGAHVSSCTSVPLVGMSFDLTSFLAAAVGQIPDAGEQTVSLKKLMEQRLRAEYEHPRVKEFEFCLQQSFPPERIRHLLFHPSPQEFKLFPLLLRRAPDGAPAEHPQNTIQLTALSLLHLVHCKSWDLVAEFVLHGGLNALVRLFCADNMFCRGQAVETFLQMTSHPDFDWFQPPTWHQATALHSAMLHLANPDLAFIGSLISNVPSPVPGVGLACLEILGFWLSWARKLHTQGNPLHVSRILLDKLREISTGSVGSSDDDVRASPEESEFSKRLFDDFSRFPTAEDVGAAANEMLASKDFVAPVSDPDTAVDTSVKPAEPPKPPQPSLPITTEPVTKKAVVWTMSDEDKDTYVWVLAAVRRRAGFGGTVVGIGEGSTEFDSKQEEALLTRTSDTTPSAKGEAPLVQAMTTSTTGLVAASHSTSALYDDDDVTSSGKTAAAYMAAMNKKREARPVKPAGVQPATKASVSLAKVWRTTGPAKLSEFAEKLRDVGASGLVKAVGETLDEGLLLGIVQTITFIAKDDSAMATELYSQLPLLKRMSTTLTFLSPADLDAIRLVAANLPACEAVDATVDALSRLGL